MDFGSLLHQAQKNGKTSKNEGNFYKTKFEPPKKENKSRSLSANIQKFLAKKEEEERQKAEEAKRKRDELLSMRDVRATNKIKKMLKVIKSANKSVLEEAVDNNNTAVTMAGPDQPDEDDYGYVSQEASAFYSKMMEKYKSVPDEEKFSSSKKVVNHDLLSTKDRVRAAIIRHQEEEAMPHKRKRRSRPATDVAHDSHSDYEDEPEEKKQEEKKNEKPKHKRPAPPPLDFNELLKIAEKKQFEPVVIEPKKPEKIEEPERLMTKKQKREYEQLRAFRESRMKRQQERDEESSEKEPVKKMRLDSSGTSKPTNPLNIRIPKIGDKLNKSISRDPKKSDSTKNSAPSKTLEKERSSSSKPFSDDRYRKEDSRSNDRKSNDRKIDDRKSDDRKSDDRNIKKHAAQVSHSKIPEKPRETNHKASPSANYNPIKLKETTQKYDKNGFKSHQPEKRPSMVNTQRPQLPASSNHSNAKVATKPSLPNNKLNSSKNISRDSSSSVRPDQRNLKDSRVSSDGRGQIQNSNTKQPDRKPEPQKQHIKPSNYDQSKVSNRGPAPKDYQKSFSSQGKRPAPPDNKIVKKIAPEDARPSKQGSSSGSSNTKQVKPQSSETQRARVFPPPDMKKPRQFPPSDVKSAKQFPPRDMNPRKEKPRPNKSRILDDDSEYDSELDDFIDDGPQEEANDYSKYIKEIFGYDKSRYRDVDEDDTNMESNFSQVMREEYISKKIGIMEDLEDMRMEAEEKKKKMQQKKRRILD